MEGVVKASPPPGRCLKAIESLHWEAWMAPFSHSACTQVGLPSVGPWHARGPTRLIFFILGHTSCFQVHNSRASHLLKQAASSVNTDMWFQEGRTLPVSLFSPKAIHMEPVPLRWSAFFPPQLSLLSSLIALYEQYKLLFKYFGPDVV